MSMPRYSRFVGRLRAAGAGLAAALLVSCAAPDDARLAPRSTLFIGVDVSGSFQNDGRYDDAMEFASYYIYGHLHGLDDLSQPKAMFVGSIGGERPGQPQAFHPIHDFEGKTPAEIEADLREWFPPDDRLTDFNTFFQRAATLVKRQNLALAPITLVLLTDGVPDLGQQDREAEPSERYGRIDLDPLEYLARNVTVRVLYPDPEVAVHWERDVPRDRVRMWTVDAVVMDGWRQQLREPDQVTMASEPRIRDARVRGPEPADETPAPSAPSEEESAPDSEPEEAPATRPDPATDAPVDTLAGTASADSAEPEPDDAAEAGARPSAGVESDLAAEPIRRAPPRDQVISQPDLWRWIKDNVDFRVRRTIL